MKMNYFGPRDPGFLDETKIEDFIREINTCNDNSSNGQVPASALLQLKKFRSAAGFQRSQILNRDKWLCRISVNSTLNSFAQGIATELKKQGKEDPESLIFICNLLLEASDIDHDLVNHFIMKLTKNGSCVNSYQTFTKVLQMANDGFLVLKLDTLHAMFRQQTSLLDFCYETLLSNKTEENLTNSWLVKMSSGDAELYQLVCKLMEKDAAVLPKFVEIVSRIGNVIPLYASQEQPCVILCQAILGTHIFMRQEHIPKVMEQLLQLWLTHPDSVFKLLNHFPQLADWVADYCDRDVSAKRLCLHFLQTTAGRA